VVNVRAKLGGIDDAKSEFDAYNRFATQDVASRHKADERQILFLLCTIMIITIIINFIIINIIT
jgi:type IV secretory pathway component VirB8